MAEKDHWFCEISGIVCGPISFDELTFLKDRGKLRAENRVRQGTTGLWQTAKDVPRLFGAAQARPQPIRGPETVKQPADPTVSHEPPGEEIEPQEPVAEHSFLDPVPVGPPLRRRSRDRQEKTKRALMGSGIGAAIVLLVLLLLWLPSWTAGGGGDGIAQDGGGAGRADSGEAQGPADGDGTSSQDAAGDDSAAGGGSSENPSSTPPEEPTTPKSQMLDSQSEYRNAA